MVLVNVDPNIFHRGLRFSLQGNRRTVFLSEGLRDLAACLHSPLHVGVLLIVPIGVDFSIRADIERFQICGHVSLKGQKQAEVHLCLEIFLQLDRQKLTLVVVLCHGFNLYADIVVFVQEAGAGYSQVPAVQIDEVRLLDSVEVDGDVPGEERALVGTGDVDLLDDPAVEVSLKGDIVEFGFQGLR